MNRGGCQGKTHPFPPSGGAPMKSGNFKNLGLARKRREYIDFREIKREFSTGKLYKKATINVYFRNGKCIVLF
jgi:hypothetical protein